MKWAGIIHRPPAGDFQAKQRRRRVFPAALATIQAFKLRFLGLSPEA